MPTPLTPSTPPASQPQQPGSPERPLASGLPAWDLVPPSNVLPFRRGRQ